MANPYSSLVNDALYKAKLQRKLLVLTEEQRDKTAEVRALLLSHREALFYHLVCAYRLFLRELAHAQNLSITLLQHASELRGAGDSAEAIRLDELEKTPNSFLAIILREERKAWAIHAGAEASRSPADLISVVSVAEDCEDLQQLIEAMQKVIAECRETLIEW